jgi:hypothetical protein
VRDLCFSHVVDLVARITSATAQVRLFVVEKERLIEQADLLHRLAPEHHAHRRRPRHLGGVVRDLQRHDVLRDQLADRPGLRLLFQL